MSLSDDPVFEEWVREARETDILAVYDKRGHARLKKSGAEHIGPCPACGGRDRFSINTAKQIFHCRGSGAGGDVIAMLRYIDGGDFLAACEDRQTSSRSAPRSVAPHPPGVRPRRRNTASASAGGCSVCGRVRSALLGHR
jgi:phage/plasmid primase-like uncharacterized protein